MRYSGYMIFLYWGPCRWCRQDWCTCTPAS